MASHTSTQSRPCVRYQGWCSASFEAQAVLCSCYPDNSSFCLSSSYEVSAAAIDLKFEPDSSYADYEKHCRNADDYIYIPEHEIAMYLEDIGGENQKSNISYVSILGAITGESI